MKTIYKVMLGAAALGVGAGGLMAQSDRAAFDRARANAWRKAAPTYQHNPVVVRIDGMGINLHAITAYHAGDGDTTVIHPALVSVNMSYEDFDEIMRRYTREGMWRPDLPAGG